MKDIKVKRLCQGAVFAAVYVILTWISAAFGLSGNNLVQVRLSEALCIFACGGPAMCAGLTIGCLISNIIFGGTVIDCIFGTLATLIGAIGTLLLRKSPSLVKILPPILANTLIVPFVLKYGYGMEMSLWILALYVLIGEVISCGALGILLYKTVLKNKKLRDLTEWDNGEN